MASKKGKAAPADDNLDELFSGIGGDDSKSKKPANPKTGKQPAGASKTKGAEQDPLADLESQLASQQASSRPHTPRLKDGGPKRSTATPPAGDDRAAAAGRKSNDSARSLRATFTPSATSSELHESEKRGPVEQQHLQQEEQQGGGGGWWGGIVSMGSAAMKQAEAAYKEIQQNDEAKKWADQVKGLRGIDVGALRNYGDELRHRAMPAFTNILHTLAPPISSHERLLIHITHDLVGYPSLDPLIHSVFARVMSQVEGGDLLVVQRGHESGSRRHGEGAGWRDGPWWRHVGSPRELGIVKGLTEGTKLCRAGADAYANEYFAANGGLEQAKVSATEVLSESNPVRTSNLFLAVQAIGTDDDKNLFARTATAEKERESATVQDQDSTDELVCFAIFILDPIHEIEYATVSQTIPAKWVRWLDAPTPLTPRSGDDGPEEPEEPALPEDVKEILDNGGVDPREWVAEWIEEVLDLAVGVVAQRYVARRMGVGEGGLGRGKRRVEELVQDHAGEAARAGVL